MAYQQGVDSAGYVIVGDRTATRFKGGITAIQCTPAPRAWIAPSETWLDAHPDGGFREGYLYREMVKSGFEIFAPVNPDPEEDLHTVMVFAQGVDLGKYDTLGSGNEKHYTMAYISSNKGVDDADLMSSVRKAWQYSFGWESLPDTVYLPAGTPTAQIPYLANGSHEDGLTGGCCGCQVTKLSGSAQITIAGGEPGDCSGALTLSQSQQDATYSAIIGVVDMCAEYADQRSITIIVGAGGGTCDCPYQSDFNADSFLDALDLNAMIDALFFGGSDPQDPDCPATRADFNFDGVADALDLNVLIDHLFFAGNPPCDPCNPVQGTCAP